MNPKRQGTAWGRFAVRSAAGMVVSLGVILLGLIGIIASIIGLQSDDEHVHFESIMGLILSATVCLWAVIYLTIIRLRAAVALVRELQAERSDRSE